MPSLDVDIENLIIPKYYDLLENILDHDYTHYKLYGGRGSTKSSFISLALPSTIVIAPSWQAFAHAPQPLHLFSSISIIFLIIIITVPFRYAIRHKTV